MFLADIKSERTISRKLREMIYALKIERAYSKDEILEAYLNTFRLGDQVRIRVKSANLEQRLLDYELIETE